MRIIFISGPCGCGKSTLTDALAKHLALSERKTVYVIHGDAFHDGFVSPEDSEAFSDTGLPYDAVKWEDLLRFNWDCILYSADRALREGIDVLIDYVIEDELPRVTELARRHHAELSYIVLTAQEEVLEARIRARGDTDLIERAKFLKRKLGAMPENQGHLYDNSEKSVEDELLEIHLSDYLIEI